MNIKLLKNLICGSLLVLILACSDEVVQEPLENNSNPPEPVSNVEAESLPGKIRLTYTLPANQDLLYIKASYMLDTGREMEVKSSYYSNTMILEGFRGTSDVDVNIVAVNRSEIESDPVEITVSPRPSPIFDVYESIETGEAFGGIYINAENPTRQELAILAMTKNEEGDWVVHPNSIYTSTNEISQQIRGFDTIFQDFAFVVRDRWLNHTDTIYSSIKPLFEQAIPKSGYADLRLPNDAPGHNSTPKHGMWDGNYIDWPSCYLTQGTFLEDTHITSFDMGTVAKLSRIVIWDYPEYYNGGREYYYNVCMKRFEIYGSETLDTTGDLENWTLLGTYEEVKPSGLPYGQSTNEDFEAANSGFSWDIDPSAPPMRYIRIRMLDNWAGTYSMGIAELQVYGNTNM